MARTSRRQPNSYRGGRVVGNLAYDERYAERRAPRRESRAAGAAARGIHPPAAQAGEEGRPSARARAAESLRRAGARLCRAGRDGRGRADELLRSSTSISADVVSMQKELKTLDAEHVALLTQYERTFDLETVKAAAVAAGMNKPSFSQINYIDLSALDSVELCEAQNVSVLSRVFTSLGQGVFSVVEYFS